MIRGRKGFGEELKIIQRYSELSDSYFKRIKEYLESDNKEDQKYAMDKLTGAFIKMIPQNIDANVNNNNINANVECTPEEYNAVKQALLNSIQEEGSGE